MYFEELYFVALYFEKPCNHLIFYYVKCAWPNKFYNTVQRNTYYLGFLIDSNEWLVVYPCSNYSCNCQRF